MRRNPRTCALSARLSPNRVNRHGGGCVSHILKFLARLLLQLQRMEISGNIRDSRITRVTLHFRSLKKQARSDRLFIRHLMC